MRRRCTLTKSDQICEGFVIKPAEPLDEFAAKVSQMSNRTAEARQSQFEKDRRYLRCGTHRVECAEATPISIVAVFPD
jgi:hypothetical protein